MEYRRNWVVVFLVLCLLCVWTKGKGKHRICGVCFFVSLAGVKGKPIVIYEI